MRIGIVLHGPEIVDMGSAKRIIEVFKQEHDIKVKLGGTMGRTAVLDAGLEDTIDISQGLTPSETINALKGNIDLAVLLNHGKTLKTGRDFGRMVASRLDSSLPFIHIERPDAGGRIIYYGKISKPWAECIKKMLTKGNYDLPVEDDVPLPPDVRFEGDKIIRKLTGAFPGENIRLEGIVIGHVTHRAPEVVCRDGKVVELRGGKIKPHGLEKLKSRRIDLFTARVKTGSIRRTRHKPRVKTMRPLSKTVAIIDHCAEHTFELIKNAGLVITVGDDTTAVAADVLARFGIPVIGVTDGDLDCILEGAEVPVGSVILRVREGFDDIVGRKIFDELMEGKQKIHIQESEELVAGILGLAEKYIVGIKYY